jgi:hypothetical protein
MISMSERGRILMSYVLILGGALMGFLIGILIQVPGAIAISLLVIIAQWVGLGLKPSGDWDLWMATVKGEAMFLAILWLTCLHVIKLEWFCPVCTI